MDQLKDADLTRFPQDMNPPMVPDCLDDDVILKPRLDNIFAEVEASLPSIDFEISDVSIVFIMLNFMLCSCVLVDHSCLQCEKLQVIADLCFRFLFGSKLKFLCGIGQYKLSSFFPLKKCGAKLLLK